MGRHSRPTMESNQERPLHMKTLVTVALALPLIGCTAVTNAPAEQLAPPPPVEVPATSVIAEPAPTYAMAPAVFTDAQLDILLGPIALYPDALIALILPASTTPSDLVAAADYLNAGGDIAVVDSQPWEDSVHALARYPDVVKWMAENMTWSQQLGQAFSTQPAQVMNAIQRLRARARAAGTLVDTPQQRVIYEDTTIVIVPAQPDVIYVPYYDPAVVYAPRAYYSSPAVFFNYSRGYAAGWWLSFGVDWHERSIWTVNASARERFWRERHDDWRHHYEPPRRGTPWAQDTHSWQPPHVDPRRTPPVYTRSRSAAPTRPAVTPAPTTTRTWQNDDRWRTRPSETRVQSNVSPPPAVTPVIPPTATVAPPSATPPYNPGARGDWRNSHGRGNTPVTTPAPAVSPPPPAQSHYQSPAPGYQRGNVPPTAATPGPHHGPPQRPQPAPQPASQPQTTDQQTQPQQQPAPPPQNDDDNRRRGPGRRAQPD